MQSVILAGGLGTRLRPLTHITAKLMLKVYGKPFLEYHIESLKKHGIDDIVILVGHLGSQIKSHFGNGKQSGVNIRYSEDDMLGSGGAIKNAFPLLEDVFLVLNGDTYLPIDYNALIDKFRRDGKDALMTVYDNNENIRPNNVCIRDGEITEYNNAEPKPYFTHLDAGVSIFKKSVFSIGVQRFSLEKDVYPQLISARQLGNVVSGQRFFDIHTLERLENIRKIMQSS
ncbi:MAG: NTP transferase domain-containing protein [Candidatus Aenigmarchaeota archaeon]|nr:NTP transferase domain-containing protein [Candidatus Aenigmarchaeota archaeon]